MASPRRRLKSAADRLLQSVRRGVVQDTIVYALGNATAALLPLAILPVLTRRLSTEEFGFYANVLAFVAFLVPLVNLGLSNVVARDYIRRQELDYPRLVSTCMWMSAGCLILVAFALLAVTVSAPDLLARFLGKTSITLVVAALLMLASQAALPTALAIWQMQRRVFLYSAVRVFQLGMFALVAIPIVILFSTSGETLVFAKAGVDVLVLGFCVLWLAQQKLLVRRTSASEGVRCIRYGLPLVPHMLSIAAVGAMDRLIITYILGVGAAGIYSVGHQIGMVMWLVVNSTNLAWQPWFYRQMQDGTTDAYIRVVRASAAVAIGWLLIAVLLWLIAPSIVKLVVGETFHDAAGITRWIIFGFLFQGLYSLGASYLYFSGHTGRLAIATIITAVTHVVMTFILTTRNGIEGAAQAAMLAYFFYFVMVYAMAQYTFRMPWLHAFATSGARS